MSFREFVGSLETSLGVILAHNLPYKSALKRRHSLTAAELNGDPVPHNEVWNVTAIHAETSGAAGDCFLAIKDATETYYIYAVANSVIINWTGNIWLDEGDYLYINMPIGDLLLFYFGVIRYSYDAVIDLLHKTRAIPLERDVQSPEPRPDPRM